MLLFGCKECAQPARASCSSTLNLAVQDAFAGKEDQKVQGSAEFNLSNLA